MVDLIIICKTCSKPGLQILNCISIQRIKEMVHSWDCECGEKVSNSQLTDHIKG